MEVSNYKNIAAAKRKVEITDKDIDAELKRMQERNARMVDVDDRPVEKGVQFVQGVKFADILDKLVVHLRQLAGLNLMEVNLEDSGLSV